jgi:hypothetical protein
MHNNQRLQNEVREISIDGVPGPIGTGLYGVPASIIPLAALSLTPPLARPSRLALEALRGTSDGAMRGYKLGCELRRTIFLGTTL